jgi:hypothetical protein
MKIFIVGLPQSCRTTVAKSIAGDLNINYIDAMSWVRSTFRGIKEGEHPHQYEDDFQQYLTKRLLVNPWFITDHVCDMMKVIGASDNDFVIDGVASPRDFTYLFDYEKDIIVFLNRTDNDNEYRDHENIGTSVIRDYCFWMSAAGVLSKQRWMEYNFRVPGEPNDNVKAMGAQNSVFIVKSIDRVKSHLKEKIQEITNAIPQ